MKQTRLERLKKSMIKKADGMMDISWNIRDEFGIDEARKAMTETMDHIHNNAF